MIRRNAERALRELAGQYPVVTVTGPRQSGKTTLCRSLFAGKPYVNLEPIDVRDRVRADPRGFLAQHADGAVIDEVQHVPELLSYLQAEVDERSEPGRFVLTGSEHFGLSRDISQSLAGRTTVFELLPLSHDELLRFDSAPRELMAVLWSGAYPRIFDRGIAPDRWYADYVTTYVQRDVRQLLEVGNLTAFTTFVRLCAGRSGQELNLSGLGADAGVSQPTARGWLSILETTFLCRRLPPWHRNARKQAIKAPKLMMLDSGLMCFLLGILSPEQLRVHPLRGAVFETWVAAEVYKARAHAGQTTWLSHYREPRGAEVDLVVETARALLLVEAKSGATVAPDFFEGLDRAADRLRGLEPSRPIERILVHGGEESSTRNGALILPWRHIQDDGRWLDHAAG
jgi:predicted AAA+ superfamily ATPase